MLDAKLKEQETRAYMVGRLTLYSSFVHGLNVPNADGEVPEEIVRREHDRLNESTTHDLKQLLSQLFLQYQQVRPAVQLQFLLSYHTPAGLLSCKSG